MFSSEQKRLSAKDTARAFYVCLLPGVFLPLAAAVHDRLDALDDAAEACGRK
jgi:hypothetical protein